MIFKNLPSWFRVVILIMSWFCIRELSACSWCQRDDMATLIRDKLTVLKVQALPQQEGAPFYNECVYDYYPKAYVMTQTYFTQMCPEAVDSALYEIVRVLTYDTWFYFSNQKDTFQWAAFWERVITVCELFDQFLSNARVDPTTKYVYEPAPSSEGDGELSIMYVPDLISWWCFTGKKAMFDFYALFFDYYLKLFNEGIKLEKEEKVEVYYQMLEDILVRLEGSDYYLKYEKALQRSQRLQSLLHEKQERKRWWRRHE